MEKRIFLAIVISIGFLFLWGAVAPKLFPELAKKPAPVKTSTAATSTTAKTPAVPAAAASTSVVQAPVSSAPLAASRVQFTTVDAPEYTAVFSNRGAQLVSFRLKAYNGRTDGRALELVKGRAANRTDFPFFIVSSDRATADRLNKALYALTDRTDRGRRTLARGGVPGP